LSEIQVKINPLIMASLTQQKATRELALQNIKFYLGKSTLTADEQRRYNSLQDEIKKLDSDISATEARNNFNERLAGNPENPFNMSNDEIASIKRFSLVKFINEAANHTLTGLEREMHDVGLAEMRIQTKASACGFVIPLRVLQLLKVRANAGQNVTNAADGGNLVGQMPLVYHEALANALVLPSLGATYFSGLVGNLPIVRGGKFTAGFYPEGETAVLSKESLSEFVMTPKRVSATGVFSKRLLEQGSMNIENWVRLGLTKANAQALMTAIISGLAANAEPVGILNTAGLENVIGGVDGASITWAHILEMEAKISGNNADMGSCAYLTNSKVCSKLKNTLKNASMSGHIWEKSEVNGFKAIVTNAIPSNLEKGASGAVCSPVIAGAWSDLFIANFGGLDIVVDPYSLIEQSEIKVTVNSFCDAAIANPKSFVVMRDALTA
jgi:HK97 family phage major capsid protein